MKDRTFKKNTYKGNDIKHTQYYFKEQQLNLPELSCKQILAIAKQNI